MPPKRSVERIAEARAWRQSKQAVRQRAIGQSSATVAHVTAAENRPERTPRASEG